MTLTGLAAVPFVPNAAPLATTRQWQGVFLESLGNNLVLGNIVS